LQYFLLRGPNNCLSMKSMWGVYYKGI
jgi:hypothetical protein